MSKWTWVRNNVTGDFGVLDKTTELTLSDHVQVMVRFFPSDPEPVIVFSERQRWERVDDVPKEVEDFFGPWLAEPVVLSWTLKSVLRAFRRHGTATRADIKRQTSHYHPALKVLIKAALVEECNDGTYALTKKGGTFMPSVLGDYQDD